MLVFDESDLSQTPDDFQELDLNEELSGMSFAFEHLIQTRKLSKACENASELSEVHRDLIWTNIARTNDFIGMTSSALSIESATLRGVAKEDIIQSLKEIGKRIWKLIMDTWTYVRKKVQDFLTSKKVEQAKTTASQAEHSKKDTESKTSAILANISNIDLEGETHLDAIDDINEKLKPFSQLNRIVSATDIADFISKFEASLDDIGGTMFEVERALELFDKSVVYVLEKINYPGTKMGLAPKEINFSFKQTVDTHLASHSQAASEEDIRVLIENLDDKAHGLDRHSVRVIKGFSRNAVIFFYRMQLETETPYGNYRSYKVLTLNQTIVSDHHKAVSQELYTLSDLKDIEQKFVRITNANVRFMEDMVSRMKSFNERATDMLAYIDENCIQEIKIKDDEVEDFWKFAQKITLDSMSLISNMSNSLNIADNTISDISSLIKAIKTSLTQHADSN
jgi:hypothetical protein